MKNVSILDEARNAAITFGERIGNVFSPSIRLGVTGLSRAGKTVFITSLVHNLLHDGALPLFEPARSGRLRRAWLEPQPDAHIPRFAYEDHVEALTAGEDRHWPESTSQLSQLRLTLEYEPTGLMGRYLRSGVMHVDIVDYPGEWLLDLPLLDMDYSEWSRSVIESARTAGRSMHADGWLELASSLNPASPLEEETARKLFRLYRDYLKACKAHPGHFSALQPGRFLMPGDLEGSPLLTFAPLPPPEERPPAGSLWREMERRYRAYVAHVARPFFFDHFARIDRQIVLVDTLTALNEGAAAVADLRSALASIFACFRTGSSGLFTRRAGRILFAATKADLIHHASHDRLRGILALLVEEAAKRAEYSGAQIRTEAMAAIRATREGTARHDGEELPVIIGIPEKGEEIGGEVFDGRTEAAIFPGDLPEDPRKALDGSLEGRLRFVRFRPPEIRPPRPLEKADTFPHVRLDAALQFLLGEDLA